MTIESRIVPIAFTQGLDTRTQRKLVLPGKWDTLNNLSLSEDNTPKLRDGMESLSSANGNGLVTHDNELLAISGSTVTSWSQAKSALEPVAGQYQHVQLSKTEVRQTSGMQTSPDCATGSIGGEQYTLYTWTELDQFATTQGVNCSLIDESTGTTLINNFQMHSGAPGADARAVFVGNAFFVFYIYNTHLYCRVIDPSSSLTPGAETTLINSANLVDNSFDACRFSSAAMVAYRWNDGTTSLRSIGVTNSGTTPSIARGPTNMVAQATVAVANITAVCCAAFSGNSSDSAGSFIQHTGGITGTVIDDTWTITTAATLLDATAAAAGNSRITATATGDNVRVFADQQAKYSTAALSPLRAVTVSPVLAVVTAAATLINSASFGTAAGAARGPQGPWICGKAFSNSAGSTFLPVCVMENTAFSATAPNNNTQCSFFVLDGSTARVLGKALYGAYGVPAINSSSPTVATPCSSVNISGDDFAVVVNERIHLEISNGLNVSPTGLCRLDMMPNISTPPIKGQLGPVTFTSGGAVGTYDGLQFTEHGFSLFPEGIGVATGGGGTGTVTDGTHQVIVVYEWFDGKGQRHQSSPCLAVSATLATGANSGSIILKVPSLLLTTKTGVNVVGYMTSAGGLTFNRLTLRSGHPVPNDQTAAFVTLTIIESDADISGNEPLYNQPNEPGSTLPNDSPPPAKTLSVVGNRLWLACADSPNEYRYSQELLPNGFGLQFNGLYGDTTLGGMVPSESGGIVAIAPLDEKVILLCANKIYVVYGQGPNADGSNNNFSRPQDIQSDVGCVEARSVLAGFPLGIIFKAEQGWHILGRDLSVRYVGEGVATYDANDVTSAVLLKDRKECRFTSSSGTTLVYSYLFEPGQWSTFSFSGDTYSIADMAWWPVIGSVVHVSTASGLNRDVVGMVFDDIALGTNGIAWTARTSWLAVAQLEGFQRVRKMYLTATGTNPTSDLVMTVSFDDAYGTVATGSYSDSVAFEAISIAAGMPIDIRHKLRRQKCKSVAFQFTGNSSHDETVAPITGIQALALEVGIKKGVNKLQAGQTV